MLEEEFEDTKGVIRIRKSEKDRQHNAFILFYLYIKTGSALSVRHIFVHIANTWFSKNQIIKKKANKTRFLSCPNKYLSILFQLIMIN